MCNGNYCELSQTCYRYKAIPNEYMQTYFTKTPNKGLICDYYWPLKNVSNPGDLPVDFTV